MSGVTLEDTSGTSDLVEFSKPSNPIVRILVLSLARLSGAPVFREEMDLRAPHDGVYAGIYSSKMDVAGFVTLSCVSPALKLSQYILATGYWEQLQNGMLNLIDLAELAADMDRLPVFPQVSHIPFSPPVATLHSRFNTSRYPTADCSGSQT